MRIPSLAPHLKTNSSDYSFNAETHLKPIICTDIVNNLFSSDEDEDGFLLIGAIKNVADNPFQMDKNHLRSLLERAAKDLGVTTADIVDFELSLVDVQPSTLMGIHDEFVSSERLDNMFCTMNSINSMVKYQSTVAEKTGIAILGCYDHEEVGSRSAHGAASNMLIEYTERIFYHFHPDAEREDYYIAMRKSFFSSNDVGHGLHPNYPEAHQPQHEPILNHGCLVAFNANQSFMTDSIGVSVIRNIADRANVPLQEGMPKND